MKTLIVWCLVLAAAALLELWLGVDDTGGKIALILFAICSASVPVSLFLGKVFEGAALANRDLEDY